MPAAGQIIRVTLSCVADGQLVENVVHMREMVDATLDEAINLSVEVLRHTILHYYPAAALFNQVRWKRMTPIPLDEQFAPLTGDAVGEGSGGLFNTTVALVHTLRTGTAGKTHRGRMYIGALASDMVTSNRLSAGGLALANTTCANLLARFGPAGDDPTLRLGIYSRVIGGSSPMTVAGWQQVSQIVPQVILGNQRRRRVGVGA